MRSVGHYEVQAWENLANHKRRRALDEHKAFVAESDVARHNAISAANSDMGTCGSSSSTYRTASTCTRAHRSHC